MATIYISGPITGVLDGNRTLFAAAATFIREAGHGAINPHDIDDSTGKPWETYLRQDLARLCLDADLVLALPGHHNSRGATLECDVATRAGIPVFAGHEALNRCLAHADQVGGA